MRTLGLSLLAFAVLLAGCRRGTETSASDAATYEAAWVLQQQRIEAQLDIYDRQAKRTDEQQAKSDEHDRRFSLLIEKWEEQARRYDAILDAMERQQGLKK